jgi:hypothetical protein
MKVFIFATVLAALMVAQSFAAPTETETETEHQAEEHERVKKAAYGSPAPTYGQQASAYQSAPAPAYQSAPAPQYQQTVHAGPAQSYSYPSPAPKVKCPSSLLLSCQPNVAHVPCVAPPPSYHAAPAYGGSSGSSYGSSGSAHGGY